MRRAAFDDRADNAGQVESGLGDGFDRILLGLRRARRLGRLRV